MAYIKPDSEVDPAFPGWLKFREYLTKVDLAARQHMYGRMIGFAINVCDVTPVVKYVYGYGFVFRIDNPIFTDARA